MISDESKYSCPVCYFPEMGYPPADCNICPCCGCEFEIDDYEWTHQELREAWIQRGLDWFFGAPPENWDAMGQLLRGEGVPIQMTPKEDKPEWCQSCHFETTEVELFTHSFEQSGIIKDLWLCDLCASSLAENVARYYNLYDSDVRMLSGLIMNAANRILAELRKLNEKKSEQ